MDEEKLAIESLQAYREARTVLNPLLSSLELLGLLRGASASGMLALAQRPVSPEQIAAAMKMDKEQVIEFCMALDAHGVFVKENGNYRLADKWLTVTATEVPFPFQTVLDSTFARAKVLQAAASGGIDFWTLTSEDRLALAKGNAIDPGTPKSDIILKSMLRENLPELHTILSAGGRSLELGCGTAGGLLNTLRAYPNLSSVGVEIAADLVAEAQRRAVALGLEDRIVFWQGDAQDFKEHESFDYVFWSQFFFPPATRSRTLHVAYHALKPGGILMTPVATDPSVINEQLHTETGQGYMRSRIIFTSWGVHTQSSQELRQELEEAGFEILRPVVLFNPMIAARRPIPNNP
jgi:ubiquinone/menaquinone biosynthesis C-methylase UbiE